MLLRYFVFCAAWVFFGFFGAVAAAEEETEYFAVFFDGKKIGHEIGTRSIAEGKVTTCSKTHITMARLGMPFLFDVLTTTVETAGGRPISFETTQNLGLGNTTIKGVINDKGMLELTNTTVAGVQKQTIPWPEGALMGEGLRQLQLKEGLAEGKKISAKIFDPLTQTAMDSQITVGLKKKVDLLGRVVVLTELRTVSLTGMGEITSTTYVDDTLRILKSTAPMGGMVVEIVACDREFALGEDDVVDVMGKMYVTSPVPLTDAGSAKSIAYRLLPKNAQKLNVPSNDNQSVRTDESRGVIVMVTPAAAPKGVKFPYAGSNNAAVEALNPARFVDSDNKKVIELAKRAVGNVKDAAEAARRIEKFVAAYIQQKSLSVGYASAGEVAVSREGDCTEHAVLTAAMCRAVGIPAQVVVGVLYADEFGGVANIFVGHAWAQAYIGDKWVGLDATRAPNGYDARHIALAVGNGNPAEFFGLVPLLGQFTIADAKVTK